MNNIPIQQARTIEVQTPISAEESRWQDLRRARNIYLPILLTAFIAILAAIGYITIHPERFVKLGTAPTAGLWPVAGLMSTILGPILVITIGIVFLMKTGSSFIRAFYRPPEDMKLQPLIRRRLVGVPPAPVPLSAWMKYPFVTIREPVLREDHWVRWLGGPATLVIYDGAALYLERGNKFSRVVGPGTPPMPFLERYETVKAVIDLRPQVDTRQMHPWTKDGIQLDLEVKLECQIDASEEARNASLNLVYPYDPLAVKKAVEYTAVRYDSDRRQLVESNWVDGVWGQVTGFILGHFSRHSIDEISLAELEDIGPSEGHIYTYRLAQENIDEINRNLARNHAGAHVLNIQLLVRFPAEVDEKRIAYWESLRQKISAIRESKAEANRIRVREQARAKVERDLLNSIIERLKHVDPANLTEPLLLSLTGILDDSLDDPIVRPMIAKQSLELLEKLRKILTDRF